MSAVLLASARNPLLETATKMELLPPKLRDLFFGKNAANQAEFIYSRYKIAHGGRGAAKSVGFASVLVVLGTLKRLRILCVREMQNSIEESVYANVKARIEELGLGRYYNVMANTIEGLNGTQFIFAGIKNNTAKIRSMHGVNICWVEEADVISEDSWEILIPSIRPSAEDPNAMSEIWLSLNPGDDSDPTTIRFLDDTPPDCRRVEVNYYDNPWFPKVLELERQAAFDKIARAADDIARAHLKATYDHVWLGKRRKVQGGAYFTEACLLYKGAPVQPAEHIEYIFCTIDTALKSGRENDGCGSIIWSFTPHEGIGVSKLTILDWDLKQIDGALLINWLPGVYDQMESWAKRLKCRMGVAGAIIEEKGSGTILIQQARLKGLPVHEIDGPLTKMGKQERTLDIAGYVHVGDVKISQEAYDRVVTYKNVTRNHLLHQVLKFTPLVTDQIEDDLLDCFDYGIGLTLGNHEGF